MTKIPVEISFNVIYGYRCNYACQGCCVGSNHVKDTAQDPNLDITLEAIERLPSLISLKDSAVWHDRGMITLLGGEPMMYWHERIRPLARQIRKVFPRARVNIFSNGHLLNKHASEVIDFIDEINASISVSKHLVGDLSSSMGQRWQENIKEFLGHPKIVKLHDDHWHVINNIYANIHFGVGEQWFTWYKQDDHGNIKPHATGRPNLSIMNGCASGRFCSSLYENRLYKCSSLAMLPGLLSSLGQQHDADWFPYLDAPYVDVFDPDPRRLSAYRDSYGTAISQCDMCNDQPNNVIKWTDRRQNSILPMAI